MEEALGKMFAQGIEVWWPEEGDRRKGATAGRADERSLSLVDVRRRKEDMTGGSHKEVKYLGVTWADRPPLQSGPSGGRVLHLVIANTQSPGTGRLLLLGSLTNRPVALIG